MKNISKSRCQQKGKYVIDKVEPSCISKIMVNFIDWDKIIR